MLTGQNIALEPDISLWANTVRFSHLMRRVCRKTRIP